jgi:flagellar biosynthetic protein FliQ
MSQEIIMEIMQSAIWTVITAAAPPLIMGLTVGVSVSLFQTITSIQEATLAFVPKILAVFLALMIFGSWMLSTISSFIISLYENIPYYLAN